MGRSDVPASGTIRSEFVNDALGRVDRLRNLRRQRTLCLFTLLTSFSLYSAGAVTAVATDSLAALIPTLCFALGMGISAVLSLRVTRRIEQELDR